MNEVYLDKLKLEFDRIKPVDTYSTDGSYGIIYVGGGKYWPGIAVGIKMLRVYSNLPVEVWYRGKCETVNPDDVKDCENVTFCDVDEYSDKFNDNRIPQGIVKSGGWEAKSYALMHTKFSKVLYLDGDAYVVNNPLCLFNYLNDYAFAYWKDIPKQLYSVKWNEIWPNGDNGVVPVQGGQLLIDRDKAWKLIHCSFYMCQNSDYYFRHMYGDQDSWRVGLAMGCCNYHVIDKADWQSVAFVCRADHIDEHGFCHDMFDKAFIVHRCQGKLYQQSDIPIGKSRYTNPQYHLPNEKRVFEFLGEILRNRQQSANQTFKNIYDKRLWGNHSSASGAGSTLKEAKLYIDKVNYLIRSNGYMKLIDVGCGDGLVGNHLECEEYFGYDCVRELTIRNKLKFKNSRFFTIDIFSECDIIEYGDILVCKDVLHHWPNDWITKWLSYLIESKKWKAIVLCQDSKQLQQDTFLGGYRGLDFREYPLNQFPLKFIAHVHHKDLLLWEQT